MKVNLDILDLTTILNYVQTVPLIPKRRTAQFRKYCTIYEQLIEMVPNTAGIYVWVGQHCERLYQYVGMSEKGLQNRFDDEFWQEYSVQWETVHGENPTISLACQHYPKWIDKITSQSYRGKAGTTFIVFHELPDWSLSDLRELEAEFIQYFDPLANEDRPIPKGYLRDSALRLAESFKNTINLHINESP